MDNKELQDKKKESAIALEKLKGIQAVFERVDAGEDDADKLRKIEDIAFADPYDGYAAINLKWIMEDLANETDATWKLCSGPDEHGNYEISTYSPAGENVIIDICGNTLSELAKSAEEEWRRFDADRHAAEIVSARDSEEGQRFYAGAPDSLRELLEDAEAIDSMHEKLLEKLQEAAETQ